MPMLKASSAKVGRPLSRGNPEAGRRATIQCFVQANQTSARKHLQRTHDALTAAFDIVEKHALHRMPIRLPRSLRSLRARCGKPARAQLPDALQAVRSPVERDVRRPGIAHAHSRTRAVPARPYLADRLWCRERWGRGQGRPHCHLLQGAQRVACERTRSRRVGAEFLEPEVDPDVFSFDDPFTTKASAIRVGEAQPAGGEVT